MRTFVRTMRLVFASNNVHKLDEVRKILPPEIEVVSLRDIGFKDEIQESGSTLEENSAIKAQAVWKYIVTHCIRGIDGVFADDTGLEVCALNNNPGVHTARWAGEEANDVENRKKLLQEMKGVTNRSARFRTVVTLLRSAEMLQMEGEVSGRITCEESGRGGFGYDSLFIPDGYESTFATLPPETKNSISHRFRAMEKLRIKLQTSN